ncbi:probable serine/threonine-protein kinase At1g01540 [Coffea eugenioides]|uniref:probable serine/threonine-protein kinase At1g01540 n=1 Tax=Coffea eugenioides TaxID=49369 RepID=UPI000F6077AA|nr:probable serine/threonine-protein kinase At1g01540 [Coffea eugenioides]
MLFALSIFICLIFILRRRGRDKCIVKRTIISKNFKTSQNTSSPAMSKRLLSRNGWDVEMSIGNPDEHCSTGASGIIVTSNGNKAECPPMALDIRPGKEYTFNEIEAATNGFADENIVGCGDYGVVYRGVLFDHTRVAIKKLLVNRGTLKDFVAGVEAMWCLRHKNLVKLLGYCREGMFRMVVYEYVDNGNLNQWLHESTSKVSRLTWEIRMSIIEGIAKGLAYLHEDSEPGITHRHLKSSNILLDKQWNPKISDFGISKFFGPEWSHATALPMGMSGYIAPECASTCILDVKSDVYSFGILVMEIVSGKTSVQYSITEIEEYLIDWIKLMVSEQKFDQVVDPSLPEMPSVKELKRILLLALRCVDPDADKRPNMGNVIHMLEPRDLLLADELVVKRVSSRRRSFKEDHQTST